MTERGNRGVPGDGGSPRREGWQPRLGLGRLRGTGARSAAPADSVEPSDPTAAPPKPRTAAPPRPAAPPRQPVPPRPAVPPRPRQPLRDAGGVFTSPVAVAGDVILSGEGATADLSESSAARLSGRAIAISGVIVVAGVLLARLLGWARTSVFGAEFGTQSGLLDTFWVAFRIPDTLFQLVAAGAVGSALVPVASQLLANGETERARRLIATVGNLMLVVLVPLALVLFVLTPMLVDAFAHTTGPDAATKLGYEVGLTRVMLVSPVLLALGAVMAAGLNSVGVFGPPSIAPNVYNIAIIVAAITLTPFFGIYALAIGVVIGAAGHVLTQARAVRQAGLWQPVLDYHDPAVRETLSLMAPRALGLGATQIVFFVNTYFAQSLATNGPLTVYTFAFTALQIPVGLIGVPLGIVLLPPLSQAIARGDNERFRTLVDQSLRMLLFVVIPLTGIMFALATPSLRLLFRYGAMTTADTNSMTPVFIVFLFGLVAHVLIALMAPIFYAGKDTRTPVTAALVAVAVDVGAAIVLFPLFQLEGLALAIGLGAWAEVGLLVAFMERRIGFDLRPMARHSVAFVGGGVVCSAASLVGFQLAERITGGSEALLLRVFDLGIGGLTGVAIYIVWAWGLHLPELNDAMELTRTLFRRTKRPA